MSEPLAYFITFTTYGTWLHGRDPGSVDREHNAVDTPFLPPDAEVEQSRREKMRQIQYTLDIPRREVVLRTIQEVANHRGWKLWAVHVRSNHVHVVVSASAKPEKIMADFKAWASRRLREAFCEKTDRDRWTQHGSTKYLWTEAAIEEKVVYAVEEQGKPMAVYDSRSAESEPEALATDGSIRRLRFRLGNSAARKPPHRSRSSSSGSSGGSSSRSTFSTMRPASQ